MSLGGIASMWRGKWPLPTKKKKTTVADSQQQQEEQQQEQEYEVESAETTTLKAALSSLMAIPICVLFAWSEDHLNDELVFLIGIASLVFVYVAFAKIFGKRDVFLYIFGLFATMAVVDGLVALTIDGRITLLQKYLEKGERYFSSGYGLGANLWDATAHFVLYMTMIYGMSSSNPSLFRPYYLYWVGSIVFSLSILLPGGMIGEHSHDVKPSTLLNVPFVLVPLAFLKRVLDTPRPIQDRAWGSPLADTVAALFVAGVLVLFAIRYLVANGSALSVATYWATVEPILLDPSAFFITSAHMWFYATSPLLFIVLMCLVCGASRTQRAIATDLVVLLCGGIAESHFCLFTGSLSKLTLQTYRVQPATSTLFWIVNGGVVVGMHLLAVYILTRKPFKGLVQ